MLRTFVNVQNQSETSIREESDHGLGNIPEVRRSLRGLRKQIRSVRNMLLTNRDEMCEREQQVHFANIVSNFNVLETLSAENETCVRRHLEELRGRVEARRRKLTTTRETISLEIIEGATRIMQQREKIAQDTIWIDAERRRRINDVFATARSGLAEARKRAGEGAEEALLASDASVDAYLDGLKTIAEEAMRRSKRAAHALQQQLLLREKDIASANRKEAEWRKTTSGMLDDVGNFLERLRAVILRLPISPTARMSAISEATTPLRLAASRLAKSPSLSTVRTREEIASNRLEVRRALGAALERVLALWWRVVTSSSARGIGGSDPAFEHVKRIERHNVRLDAYSDALRESRDARSSRIRECTPVELAWRRSLAAYRTLVAGLAPIMSSVSDAVVRDDEKEEEVRMNDDDDDETSKTNTAITKNNNDNNSPPLLAEKTFETEEDGLAITGIISIPARRTDGYVRVFSGPSLLMEEAPPDFLHFCRIRLEVPSVPQQGNREYLQNVGILATLRKVLVEHALDFFETMAAEDSLCLGQFRRFSDMYGASLRRGITCALSRFRMRRAATTAAEAAESAALNASRAQSYVVCANLRCFDVVVAAKEVDANMLPSLPLLQRSFERSSDPTAFDDLPECRWITRTFELLRWRSTRTYCSRADVLGGYDTIEQRRLVGVSDLRRSLHSKRIAFAVLPSPARAAYETAYLAATLPTVRTICEEEDVLLLRSSADVLLFEGLSRCRATLHGSRFADANAIAFSSETSSERVAKVVLDSAEALRATTRELREALANASTLKERETRRRHERDARFATNCETSRRAHDRFVHFAAKRREEDTLRLERFSALRSTIPNLPRALHEEEKTSTRIRGLRRIAESCLVDFDRTGRDRFANANDVCERAGRAIDTIDRFSIALAEARRRRFENATSSSVKLRKLGADRRHAQVSAEAKDEVDRLSSKVDATVICSDAVGDSLAILDRAHAMRTKTDVACRNGVRTSHVLPAEAFLATLYDVRGDLVLEIARVRGLVSSLRGRIHLPLVGVAICDTISTNAHAGIITQMGEYLSMRVEILRNLVSAYRERVRIERETRERVSAARRVNEREIRAWERQERDRLGMASADRALEVRKKLQKVAKTNMPIRPHIQSFATLQNIISKRDEGSALLNAAVKKVTENPSTKNLRELAKVQQEVERHFDKDDMRVTTNFLSKARKMVREEQCDIALYQEGPL
eukprot:g2785.t1